MVDCGKYKDARFFLFKNRLYLNTAGGVASVKLRWIEGRINYGNGDLEIAEISFRAAKIGFQEADMAFASALAGLDLAITLLRQGCTQEAIREGLESTAMFFSLNISRELLGSFVFLEKAFKSKVLNLADLEETARYLRRMQIALGIK
jgi:hypothetical protein